MINRTHNLVAVLVVLLVPLPIYWLRLDAAAGLMVDDAWYVLLAKALAEGRGYRLISSAATEILPLYPPGLPAILSLVFRVSPEFPQNVWLLKSVSIAAMLAVGPLSYAYLHRHRNVPRDIAFCAAVALAVTPAFVFLATSTLMSECVFTLAQLGAVVLLHRSVDARDTVGGRLFAIGAAIVAAAAVLTRSAGAGLVLAAALWLLKERRWKRAALFTGVVAVSLIPWMLYARAHAPTAEQRAAHGGAIVYGYTDQVWMRWAGTPELGRIRVGDLPARVQTNLIDVFGRDVAGILMPALFRGASESGQEVLALGGVAGLSAGSMGGATATMVISCVLSGILLMGFVHVVRQRLTVAEFLVPISLAAILLWPFWSYRFVLPLTPFLFFYFVRGLQILAPLRVVRIAMLCIIGLNLYDHARYILQARDPARSDGVDWIAHARDVDAALDWMNRSLGNKGGLAASNPALVYLRTGRKSIAFDHSTADWSSWKRRGVRYIACLLPLDLPAASQGKYKILYQSPGRLWVIEI